MISTRVDVAWHERIAVVDTTGCWISIPPRPPWQVSRRLIAELFDVPEVACGITPSCVHPAHNPDTRRPAGAAS